MRVVNEDQVRRSFETKYATNPHNTRRNEIGDYVLPSIQDAWAGWLAAHHLLAHEVKILDDAYEDLDPRFAKTQHLVEATDYEAHICWEKWHDDKAVTSWKEDSSGKGIPIAMMDERPVYVQCNWATINGELVMFWHVCSQVADYSLAQEWVRKACPLAQGSTTDARNFHICIGNISRNQEKAEVG